MRTDMVFSTLLLGFEPHLPTPWLCHWAGASSSACFWGAAKHCMIRMFLGRSENLLALHASRQGPRTRMWHLTTRTPQGPGSQIPADISRVL